MTKKKFSRKPYDKFLYKWSPDDDIKKNPNKSDSGKRPYFCKAKPRSQGEDWITTYVYEIVNTKGIIKRIAYVECDYVA